MKDRHHSWIVPLLLIILPDTKSQRYRLWSPPHSNRTDLYCSVYACPPGNSYFPFDSCCALLAVTKWKMSSVHNILQRLQIDQTDDGESVIMGEEGNSMYGETYNEIYFIGGKLQRLPKNICDFPNIVEINMNNNLLTSVDQISCVTEIDSLFISGNRITSLTRDTFKNNRKLRILDISNNRLTNLQPHTFDTTMIVTAFLDYNQLPIIDISNFRLKWPFNFISLRKNKIHTITGLKHYDKFVIEGDNYGPGLIDFSGNNITKEISAKLSEYGMIATANTGVFFGFNQNTDINNWLCNCKVVPYLHYKPGVYQSVSRISSNAECYGKKNRKNSRKVTSQDLFTPYNCTYTLSDGCPGKCLCYYKVFLPISPFASFVSSEHVTIIDCRGAKLKNLPERLPKVNNIELILSESQISTLSYRDYLKNVSKLNLSNSKLFLIDKAAIPYIVDIKELALHHTPVLKIPLPPEWVVLDPCRILTERRFVKCTGESEWIVKWLDNKWCHKQEILYCAYMTHTSNLSGSNHFIVYFICLIVIILMISLLVQQRKLFNDKIR